MYLIRYIKKMLKKRKFKKTVEIATKCYISPRGLEERKINYISLSNFKIERFPKVNYVSINIENDQRQESLLEDLQDSQY